MKETSSYIEELNRAADASQTCYLFGTNLPILFQTRILDVKKEQVVLKNPIPPDLIDEFARSKHFSVKVSMISLRSEEIFPYKDQILFPCSTVEDLKEMRESERIYYSDKEKAYCSFLNPVDKMTIIKKPIIEMSEGGLSLKTNMNSKLFEPGLILKECRLHLNDTLVKSTDLKLVYSRQLYTEHQEKLLQVGFQFVE